MEGYCVAPAPAETEDIARKKDQMVSSNAHVNMVTKDLGAREKPYAMLTHAKMVGLVPKTDITELLGARVHMDTLDGNAKTK